MPRPRAPLIDRDEVIAKALALIDGHGLAAFNIRRLSTEMGVSSASLYHHFGSKDEILEGVRVSVIAGMNLKSIAEQRWSEWFVASAVMFRGCLLAHPNVVPLMMYRPESMSFGTPFRQRGAQLMKAAQLPSHLVLPICESVEYLCIGSVLTNPNEIGSRDYFGALSEELSPLTEFVAADTLPSRVRFETMVRALLAGWTSLLIHGYDPTSGK